MGNKVNAVFLVVLLFSACLSACTKSTDVVAIINAQVAKDDVLINRYLTNNNIKAKVVDSAGVSTGIYYTVDTIGTRTLFTGSTAVTVGYTGWLLTSNATLGPVIGQSNGSGQSVQFHPSFILGVVMRGWYLGISIPGNAAEIGNGGAITLYLPSKYAYGPFAQPTIGLPANSVLIFHITLYNVTN